MIRLPPRIIALVAAGASAAVIAGALVGEKEGFSLRAYQDGAGIWTICTGSTSGVRPGQRATPDECAARLDADMATAFVALDRLVTVEIPEPTRAALASWVFNVGAGAAGKSTLILKLNAGDRAGACDQLLRWVFVGGRDCRDPANNCRGIVTRRQEEAALCRM